jgi:hypothetical protein
VVIIGPSTKVDPAKFPKRRTSIGWVGAITDNSGYVKELRCLYDALRDQRATEFINPTKALEYMATGRPIVSTAIEDVVLQFSEVVDVANSHAEFITACERAVAKPDVERIQRGLKMASQNSGMSLSQSWKGTSLTCSPPGDVPKLAPLSKGGDRSLDSSVVG